MTHSVVVQGVDLSGTPQDKPALLMMNDGDFPKAFLRDLGAIGKPPLSSTTTLAIAPGSPATLFQPVARVFHLAVVQLSCESPGYPRLDPKRVISAGLVIRQAPQAGGPPAAALPWMKNGNGQFAWVPQDPTRADIDPDPAQRPQLQSGQPALDRLLAAQTLSTALTESTTPAFVAAPDVCNAAGRTLAYAVVPTASSESSTQQGIAIPAFDAGTLSQLLTPLLQGGTHLAPQAGNTVNYKWMSDDFVRAIQPSATDFLVFSTTLRLLYTALGAFDQSSGAIKLRLVLNRHKVTMPSGATQPMGDFYRDAAKKLIDYVPTSSSDNGPPVIMPTAWDSFSDSDEQDLMNAMIAQLQSRGNAASVPQGRFQDATQLYRARLFFRIKGETPSCPPDLVWSDFTDPFRIGAWYESAGRPVAPIPLPDPFDRNVLKNAKPTCAFAVPPSLMSAINGANMTDLSSGKGPSGGGGVGLGWICSFSIPLVTICAFFILNLFLSLLNIVFFWMAFIKICIPVPQKK